MSGYQTVVVGTDGPDSRLRAIARARAWAVRTVAVVVSPVLVVHTTG